MLNNTSTRHAPWHLIPADLKWFAHAAVADIINRKLASLKLHFPDLNEEQKKALRTAKKLLEEDE